MGTFTMRAAMFADAAALGALERAIELAWWGEEESDDADIRHHLELAGDLDAHARVLVGVDGALVGFAVAFDDTSGLLSVSPALVAVDRDEAYGRLIAWHAAEGARELDARSTDGERLGLLAREGYHPVRSSFDLELAADHQLAAPRWPAGVALHAFDADAHAPALHALIYSVWSDVDGHHDRPFEEWRRIFLGHEAFDPALQVVAVRGGAMVGAAVCQIFGGKFGWLSQLVVGRDARGLGLGRALLLEGLRRMRAIPGVDGVGLSVIATNVGALGLYRSAGLEVDREFVICAQTA